MAAVVMPMMVIVRSNCFQLRGGAAAVGGLAACGFKLNGCVGDVKTLAEGAVDAVENAAAFGHRHLRDGDVAGEGVRLRAETPYMQVVDVEDTCDGGHGFADFRKLKVAGGSFEQDVQGFANDSYGAP